MSQRMPPPAKQKSNTVLTVISVVAVVVVGFIAVGILAALVLPVMAQTNERANHAHCANNLKQVSMALRAYAFDNDDQLPFTGSVSDSANKHFGLLFPNWTKDERVFICRDAANRGYRTDNTIDENPTGVNRVETLKPGENCYAFAFGLDGSWAQDSPLACDQLAVTSFAYQGWAKAGMGSNHQRDGGNVLYKDGHVEFMTATTQGFWPPKRPKMKAMWKGKAFDPANAAPSPEDR